MKKFTAILMVSLLCTGSGTAGILKMTCEKPICPCSSYGPCAGYFPTVWRAWPCASPTTVPAVTAPAKTSASPTATSELILPDTQFAPQEQQQTIMPTAAPMSWPAAGTIGTPYAVGQ